MADNSWWTMVGGKSYRLISLGLLLCVLTGCPVPQKQKVPREVLRVRDEEFNRTCFIYYPTGYGKQPMPLVVTCHGTNPWDSAQLQINEWKALAEENKFVVIAPTIDSARGFIPPAPPEGTKILQEDERYILKILRRFYNTPNIDSRAIMITGWSAGGFATYYVGLRHPEIFRVVVARQCNFVREYYPDDIWRFNPYQPLLIFYGKGDLPLLKADSQVAYRFFQDAGMKNLFYQGLNGGHSRHPEVALDFFYNAIKTYPRPAIRSAKIYADGRCRVRLDACLIGSIRDEDVYWNFGDGDSAPGRVVEHVYDRPGRYHLAVIHTTSEGTIRFLGEVSISREAVTIKPGAKR